MIEPLISIIVPVYNVEPYLERCISSIMEQSYKNFELILVDDGSPDSCGSICDAWQAKDSRVKVIHQVNRGVSAARNAALDVAKGKYFTCVDGDDAVEKTFLEKIVFLVEKEQADIGFCNCQIIRDGNCVSSKMMKCEMLCREKLERKLWGDWGYFNGACAKLFKMSIVNAHNLRYDVSLKNSEDVLFLQEYVQFVKKSVHNGEIGYLYYIRKSGSSNNISREKFSMARLAVWRKIKGGFSRQYKPWNNFILLTAADVYVDFLRHPETEVPEISEIRRFILANRFKFLMYGSKPFSNKLKLLMKLYFPKIVKRK